MRHADHGLLDACGAGLLQQKVEHRNHRVAALAGEALLADVLRVQVTLQRLRGGQALQDVALLGRRVGRPRADGLEALLDEPLGRRVVDVHVLGAERPAIRVLQRLDEVAQTHPRRPALERSDVELGVEVGVGEAVGREVEVGDRALLLPLQRIEVGLEHAERAELADHLQHQHLLVQRRRVDHRSGELAALAETDERLDHRRVRDVRRAAAQRVEIGAPVRRDRGRIGEVLLVLVLDERRVAAEERARRLELLHRIHCRNLVKAGFARGGGVTSPRAGLWYDGRHRHAKRPLPGAGLGRAPSHRGRGVCERRAVGISSGDSALVRIASVSCDHACPRRASIACPHASCQRRLSAARSVSPRDAWRP